MEFCLIQQMCHIHFIIYSPYITKEELPAQNQALYRYKAKGPSPVQNQEPFTGTEPRATLLEPNQGIFTGTKPRVALPVKCCIKDPSPVQSQKPFNSVEPRVALPVQYQALSPVQRHRPWKSAEPRTFRRYGTKGRSTVT
jgi:hypothetical protein